LAIVRSPLAIGAPVLIAGIVGMIITYACVPSSWQFCAARAHPRPPPSRLAWTDVGPRHVRDLHRR